jgi:glycosyltransferase involved in cell wall biosynthesis
MNLAIIHWSFPPTIGGVESHLWELATYAARSGIDVIVLTGESSPVHNNNFKVVSSPLLNLHWIKAEKPELSQHTTELVHLFQEYSIGSEIGTVHGHNLHHFCAAPALALERMRPKFGLRLFHTSHGTWPSVVRESRVFFRWNGVFAVSKSEQQQWEKHLGYQPEVLYLGVNTKKFVPTSKPFCANAVPVILHPARIVPWKGTEYSIRMLYRLRKQNIQAKLIITDTPTITDWLDKFQDYRKSMIDLIAQLDLTDDIELVQVPYAEMPNIYNQVDVVILPSIEEACPLVPLEAMACGRPVVAFGVGGIEETVVSGETGYLVDRRDTNELAERVAELINNPDRAEQFGQNGRTRVEKYFALSTTLSNLVARYRGERRASSKIA